MTAGLQVVAMLAFSITDISPGCFKFNFDYVQSLY